jgi:hypothetical protein
MKRILSLVLVLGVAALFSSAALAGADCSYHKTQAAVPTTDATKDVATVPAPEKMDTNQVQTAQATPQAAKPAPAPEPKK